jgi:hypothetical protein
MDRFKDKFSKGNSENHQLVENLLGVEIAKEKMNKASEVTKEKLDALKLQEKMGAAKEKVGNIKARILICNDLTYIQEQVGMGKVYEINGRRYKSKKLVGEGSLNFTLFLIFNRWFWLCLSCSRLRHRRKSCIKTDFSLNQRSNGSGKTRN